MKKRFYFFLIFITSQPIFAQTLETDRLALVEFYNSTNGANWINKTGWKVPGTPGDSPCSWYGISCSGGRVSALNLLSNNLTGSLPNEVGNLTNLSILFLYDNNLTGAIPPAIGNLTKLTTLYLHHNNLTGSIPNEIGNLTNLSELYLTDNNLTGTIPATIQGLTNITDISLAGNQLSGNIPAGIETLSKLTNLSFGDNQLTGTIPNNLENLPKLVRLDLGLNQLTGTIPAGIWNITTLTSLSLSGNQLTGSIPKEVGNLVNLEGLLLGYNQLTGSIPNEIGNLTKLFYLSLSYNQLTGSIPDAIGNLTELQFLYLNLNQLTGTIPATFGNLTKLRECWLFLNQLTGPFNLTGIPVSASVQIGGNNFNFDGIETNLAIVDLYAPQNKLTVTNNTAGMLSVNAGGTLANNTYRWYRKNSASFGDVQLMATNVGNANYTPAVSGTYYVQVNNSIAQSLTLYSEDFSINLPVFTLHPSNVSACTGSVVSLTVSASNTASYQWQVKTGAAEFTNLSNDEVYSNVTSSTLTISNTAGLDGYQYRCVGTGNGSTNSNIGTLTIGTTTLLALKSPENDITAPTFIKNASNITAANKVQTTGQVIYQASQSVVLNPGFTALRGRVFTAQIGDCN